MAPLTALVDSQAVELFCCMQQYLVKNSVRFESDSSAFVISSRMNLTGIDTPRFGSAFLSSLMSFHLSISSIV